MAIGWSDAGRRGAGFAHSWQDRQSLRLFPISFHFSRVCVFFRRATPDRAGARPSHRNGIAKGDLN